MPLQKQQASKPSALTRRNISKTSSASTSAEMPPGSKAARLQIPKRTSTSDGSVGLLEKKLASDDVKPKSKKMAVNFTAAESQTPSTSVLRTPKTGSTLASLKNFASKISRITPSKKGQSDKATMRVASEFVNHSTRILPPLSPQKTMGSRSVTNNTQRSPPVSFDIRSLKPRGIVTRKAGIDNIIFATTRFASGSVDIKKLQEPTLQKRGSTPTMTPRKASVDNTFFQATKYRCPDKPTIFALHTAAVNDNTTNAAKYTSLESPDTKKTQEHARRKTTEPFCPDLATTSDELRKLGGSIVFLKPQQSTLYPTKVVRHNSLNTAKTDFSDANTLRILSESYTTLKRSQHVSHNNTEDPHCTSDAGAANSLGAADFSISGTDGPSPIKSIESSIFHSVPTKITTFGNESAIRVLHHDQSDEIRPSIEEPERRSLFSTREYLNQKCRQFTAPQTPCPGDSTDERDEADYHGRTFPTIREFARKMARIMPTNRRERGGTLTPDGGWKPMSACPTSVGTSPSPYQMNLSPQTPGSISFVSNASQTELLNTLQEYVTQSENERKRSDEITNELAQWAQELLEEEGKLEKERRRSDEATIELAETAQDLMKQGERLLKEEQEAQLHKEQALKARIQQLEEENDRLKQRVFVDKGPDELGVTGANPVTGMWSDVGEAGQGRRKGRGRWRRTDTSWNFVPSESQSSSTGTVVRNQIQVPEGSVVPPPQSATVGSIIRYHIHHHHHWRVVSRGRRSG